MRFLFCRISFIIVSSILLLNSFTEASEKTEQANRNWTNSLNVYYKGSLFLKSDEWFQNIIANKINDAFNDEIRRNLTRSKKISGGNIAYIKHIIIYKTDEIKFEAYDPKIIFRSGTTVFKTESDLKKVKSPKSKEAILEKIEALKKEVHLASSFYSKIPSEADERKEYIFKNHTKALKNLLNYEHPEPIHAEVSAILYLFGGFDSQEAKKDFSNGKILNLLDKILNKEKEFTKGKKDKIQIIGNIVLVATLKDPCSFCMPMFYSFNKNLKNLLQKHIDSNQKYTPIKIEDNLENLILIGGVKLYEKSRVGMNPSKDKIKLYFNKLNNRLYSKDCHQWNKVPEETEGRVTKKRKRD